MLSVNIPVFNIQVSGLVMQLVRQAGDLAIDFEIRVYDDGSDEQTKAENRKLEEVSHVIYREMPRNLGRAAIRNKMGLESQKKYLLFIDGDSKLVGDDFLKKYLNEARPGIVLCGGTVYSPRKPEPEKMLRWVYGNQREAVPAALRNRKKGFIITSNNFLIDRKAFEKVHFRENIGPYGHEDTLLGFDLFSAGFSPKHIDNPVEHTGLENSAVFLDKTKAALENLHFISKNILPGSSGFRRGMPFLNHYRKITRIIPRPLIVGFFILFRKKLEENLSGKNPGLFLFDFYKLGFYAGICKNNPPETDAT